MADPRVRQLSESTTTDWTAPELGFNHVGHEPLPFSAAEYGQRQASILQRLDDLSVDALLVLQPANVEYCTGFQTMETTALMPFILTPDFTALVVPAAEVGRALRSAGVNEIASVSPFDDLLAVTMKLLARRLGRDARVGVTQTAPVIHDALEAVGVVPVVVDPVVEHERLVLSRAEQEHVRRAAVSTACGLPAAVRRAGNFADPGSAKHAADRLRRTRNTSDGALRDTDMAAAVQRSLMLTSNSLSAVPVVVAAGARSGIPHSTWCGAEVERHRPVFLEYSGAWHRYHAPVMRTICVGEPRDDRLGRLCQLAEATIAAVEETLRAGIAAADIAEAAERAIGPLEPWIVFHHNFGYPVGLGHPPTWMDCAQWSLVATNHEPVLEGTVLHVPAVFRAPAVGGVGHSQTYLVTATGCERLTATDPTISVVT